MSPRPASKPLLPAAVAEYLDAGFTIARGVFTTSEIEALRQACDDLEHLAAPLADDAFFGVTYVNIHRNADPFAKDIHKAEVVPGQIRRVTYPYAVSSTLNRLRAQPALLACVASLLGDDLVQIVNQVNFNPPKCGTGWGWHQDYRFRKPGINDLRTNFTQTITAIDRCDEITGGVRVIPKSDRWGDLTLDSDPALVASLVDESQAVTPILEPGDVLLFNSHLVHGSTRNTSDRQRRVFINGFARTAACAASHGMPVLVHRQVSCDIQGSMEYEGDRETLPKAAKY